MSNLTIITDPDVIEGYLTDASNTRGHAERLVIPRSTDEVAAVVRHCQAEGIPLTVTAQRTSTTGGPVPHGGWLLSVEALDTVYAHDDVGAGVILGVHDVEVHEGRCRTRLTEAKFIELDKGRRCPVWSYNLSKI